MKTVDGEGERDVPPRSLGMSPRRRPRPPGKAAAVLGPVHQALPRRERRAAGHRQGREAAPPSIPRGQQRATRQRLPFRGFSRARRRHHRRRHRGHRSPSLAARLCSTLRPAGRRIFVEPFNNNRFSRTCLRAPPAAGEPIRPGVEYTNTDSHTRKHSHTQLTHTKQLTHLQAHSSGTRTHTYTHTYTDGRTPKDI